MAILMSPEEVWSNITIKSDNFAETISKEYELEHGFYKEIFFNGVKTSTGVTRIFSILAYPKKNEKAPVVLVCNDQKDGIDKSYIDYFLKMGFGVFICDTNGKSSNGKYTFYPDEIEYANLALADTHLYQSENDPRDTSAFQWTLVNRYGLAFLKTCNEVDGNNVACVGIRGGSTVAWHLSAVEPDLACAVTLFYAGWNEYGKNYKYSVESGIENLNTERASYIAGIAPQSYAPYLKVPMLYLTASNDKLCNLDRAFDSMARINGAITSGVLVSPNMINKIGYKGTKDLRIWLNSHLGNLGRPFPEKPIIKLENFDGKLLCHCDIDTPQEVNNCKLYFSEGTVIPSARSWQERELTLGGDAFVGTLDIGDSNETLFAFCNVEFKNGFTVSSNYLAIEPSELGITKKLVKENLIYNGFMEVDAFTAVTDLDKYDADSTFSSKPLVYMNEAHDGISGITSRLNLSTFKLNNKRFSGEVGDILVMDINSPLPQTLKVVVLCNIDEENEAIYTAELHAFGGDLWQNFRLELNDFKDDSKVSLTSWSFITMIMFKNDEPFVLNNLLWI